jgi:predicted ATPase with chaperone activity
VALAELRSAAPGEPSAAVRDRVIAARDRQRARLAPWGVATNAEMSPAATRATCALSPAAEALLTRLAAQRRAMSARTIDRLIKVSRTIADLAGADRRSIAPTSRGRQLSRLRPRRRRPARRPGVIRLAGAILHHARAPKAPPT